MLADEPRPTRVRWGVLALASGTSWLLYLHRYAFGLMKPHLATEWKLDATQLGLMDTTFSVFYSGLQFPVAVLVDLWGVRTTLTAMLLVGSLGLGLHAWVKSAAGLWYARALLGVGQSAVYAALARISKSWYAPQVRTTLQGLVGITAGRVGGAMSNLLFASLLVGYLLLDWRTATFVFMLIGLVHTLAFALFFRNEPRGHWLVNDAEARLLAGENVISGESARATPTVVTAPPRTTVREMFSGASTRGVVNLVALSIQSLLSTFADNLFSNWLPLLLFQVHQLKSVETGIYTALPLAGGAIAGFAGGALNDFFITRTGNRRWSRIGVALAGKGVGAIWLLGALASFDHPLLFCGCLFLAKLFGDCSLATMGGVVTDIGGRATASVYAFSNSIAGLGSMSAPPIIGFVSQHYGWQTVIVLVVIAYSLCALSWLAINCEIPVLESREKA